MESMDSASRDTFVAEGSPAVTVDDEASNTPMDANSLSKSSFANVLKDKSFSYPTREQGILFDAKDNLSKNDYIIELGNLIGPKKIRFASRVSNNRICIYLSSKEVVDEVVSVHKGITINSIFFPARRLVSPAKRVVISNVSPSLPNNIIEKELKSMGLQLVSAITFIGAGINKPEYRHILSFRRQVYVVLDDNTPLPGSILITHQDNTFRLFLATDEIRCFICKKTGHIASRCSNKPDNSRIISASTDAEVTSGAGVSHSVSAVNQEVASGSKIVVTADVHTATDKADKDISQSRSTVAKKLANPSNEILSDVDAEGEFISVKKRKASSSSTSTSITSDKPAEKRVDFVKPLPKKLKNETLPDDSEFYNEFKDLFSTEMFISYDNFCKFISDTKGKQDVLAIAKLYCEDIDSLIELLIMVIRMVKTGALKARIKRLAKKLRSQGSSAKYDAIDSSQEECSSDSSLF